MPKVSNAPENEPAPREGVLDWRGMWGFEIAILIEEVGLGSDDGCSFNKIGATSHDQTIFANTSQSFTPAHDRRHERVGISR
jgi:hypothetical protein